MDHQASLNNARAKLNRKWAFDEPHPEVVKFERTVEMDNEPVEYELELFEDGDLGSASKPARATSYSRGQARPPVPWTGYEPPLELARDQGFFSMGQLHAHKLVHAMFLGGTGVGKTTSGIAPLMRAQLRYRLQGTDGQTRQTSMLIIDPKFELLASVTEELHRCSREFDLIHLGADPELPPLRFFAPGDGLTVRDKVERLDAVLQTAQLAEGNHVYWHESGLLVLMQVLNLEEAYANQCGGDSLVRELSFSAMGSSRGGFWQNLARLLTHSRKGEKLLRSINDDLKQRLIMAGLDRHEDAGVLEQYLCSLDEYTQWHYRLQSLHPMISLLAEASAAGVVDFDPFPSEERAFLDARLMIDHGMVLLYQPEATPSSELAARAIKVKVYEAVKTRADMERPIGIVIDEFQRFVTNDEVTGDAHFLDTARAYRANCVLATQSVGALLLALGNDAKARAAVDSILANTPSKWFFASKDIATRDTVRSLIPTRPGRPHLTDVRPLAQLRPGQAYWSLANGDWGLDRADLDKLL